jgi:hypothetical protein
MLFKSTYKLCVVVVIAQWLPLLHTESFTSRQEVLSIAIDMFNIFLLLPRNCRVNKIKIKIIRHFAFNWIIVITMRV